MNELAGMTVEGLVEQFIAIAGEQNKAELAGSQSRINALFWQMAAVEDELKSRAGDRRQALVPLLDHPDTQVRLKAAKAVLALAPSRARATLETIEAAGLQPQALEAGMSLWNIDRGVYKPT
jgi:hypothetical protein